MTATPSSAQAIPPELLKLPAQSFVNTAIETLGVPNVSPRDANALVQAIFRGVNKSRIWEALQARNSGRPTNAPPIVPTALVRPDDDLAVEEVLTGHAPSDDVAFLDYTAFRLMGRSLEMHERLALQARLNGGAERAAIVVDVIDMARSEGRTPVVARMNGETPFSLVSAERTERLVLMLALNDKELMVADGLTAHARHSETGLELGEGLVFAGPKKPLRPGIWRLNLDWGQHRESAICVEATANGGAEKLFAMTFSGPARFASEFRILPEHLVCELLIFAVRKGEGVDHPWIVRPREVSLSWVAE